MYRIYSIFAITDTKRVMKKVNGSVLVLWVFGYLTMLGSLGLLVFSLLKPSCGDSVSCQVENLFYQSTSIFGIFIGAVAIVFGFWKKSKDSNKDDNEIIF